MVQKNLNTSNNTNMTTTQANAHGTLAKGLTTERKDLSQWELGLLALTTYQETLRFPRAFLMSPHQTLSTTL